MKKEPFVTLEKLNEITEKFPTPFHLYDEKGSVRMQKPERGLCMEQRIQGIFCGKGNTESISDQYSAGVWLWLRLLLRNRAYDGQGSRLQKGRYHVFFQ